MSTNTHFHGRSEQLAEALASKLKLRGKDPIRQLRRARHQLPRAMRAEADVLLNMAPHMAHPKIARLADVARMDQAFDALLVHLKAIDPVERQRGYWLGLLGGMAFNLLLLAGLLLGAWWLLNRG